MVNFPAGCPPSATPPMEFHTVNVGKTCKDNINLLHRMHFQNVYKITYFFVHVISKAVQKKRLWIL